MSDKLPSALDIHESHSEHPWFRLRSDHECVGYMREQKGRLFYSTDGYGWSARPIPFSLQLPQLSRQIHARRVFHGDVVLMAPNAGAQQYQKMVVLTDGRKDCLYNCETGVIADFETLWPPPSLARAQKILGSMYANDLTVRNLDRAFADFGAGSAVAWSDCVRLVTFMAVCLAGVLAIQFTVLGAVGPVTSSFAVLLGAILHFSMERRRDWNRLRRKRMLRLSVYAGAMTAALWALVKMAVGTAGGGFAHEAGSLFSAGALGALGFLVGMVSTVIGGDLVAWRTGGYADESGGPTHFRDLG